jgi:hypothetical protein
MNSSNSRSINETSKHILIPQKSPTNKKEQFSLKEYSLKQNFFDPSKNSPPNEFMLKLQLRMSQHYASTSFISDDKRISE